MKFMLAFVLSLVMLSPAASVAPSAKGQQAETFASFWVRFKTAVAKSDKETVASLTKLPFLYDNGELGRAQFIRRYGELFDRRIQRCLPKAKPVRDGESYSVFCGEQGLFFEKVNGRYKFTSFFAND